MLRKKVPQRCAIAITVGIAFCSTARSEEVNRCPFPFLAGEYQYSSSSGESSTVIFTPIGENASRGEWRGDNGVTSSEIAGWQPKTGKVLVTSFASDGGSSHLTSTEVTSKGFTADAVLRDADLSVSRGVLEVTIHSVDHATSKFRGTDASGKKISWTGEFKRVDHTSTHEEFREFVDLMCGRWSGEITLIADWPGSKKKKGEKLTHYQTRTAVADGEGLTTASYGGATTEFDFAFYDVAAKKIRIVGTSSAGGMWDVTVWKESENVWGISSTGCLDDGGNVSGRATLYVSDEGNTLTFKGKFDVEGQEALPLNDVYRRLN